MSIALVALGAVFVFGQKADGKRDGKAFGERGNHAGRGMRGGKGMGHMFRGLDLTDAQKEQMKAIAEASRESSKTLHDQLRANREQLAKVTENGAFDEVQVQALAQQAGVLHAQMIVAKERVKSQMFAILTPEQKAKAAELKEQSKQRMEARKAKFAERKAEKAAQE